MAALFQHQGRDRRRLWVLAERGLFGFSDKIADHVPEFAKHAKGNITVLQTITHQAGFPNAVVGKDAWADHKRLREVVSSFPLEFTPGSKVHYHGLTAHWTLGVLIEAVTGKDFRDVIRETVTEPLGLSKELYVGLPESEFGRAADMHEPKPSKKPEGDGFQPSADANTADWRKAGAPGGAGYGTARAMAALYQMMLNGGELNGTRRLSPRVLQYAIRNHTGDRIDEFMGMPMHRGLGPHLRGTTENVRGLGGFASPRAFGHGGVGTSYCWGDPDSACPSPTSPTTACPTRGTPSASIWSRTSSTRRSSSQGMPGRHLSLWKQALGVVPNAVWDRTDLETLVLADNGLTEISDRVGDLRHLRMLDLGHNKLRQIPSSLGQLEQLRDFLYLHDNQLSTLPLSLGRLSRLRYLNFSENAFEALPEAVTEMSGLLELRVTDNRLTSLPGVDLAARAITRVTPPQQSAARTLPDVIGSLLELRQIDLRGNPIAGLPDSLLKLPRLEKLDLRWVTTLSPPSWFPDLERRGCAVYF